jgi:hypothetical protein
MIGPMRLASLCAILLAGTALAAGVASAARSSGDAAAVQKELAAAKTLQKKLEAATSPSRVKVSQQLGSCRGVQQPAGAAKRERLLKLIALEGVRQLQHDAIADYESYVSTVRGLHVTDARLRTAQGALVQELASAHRMTALTIDVCADLKAFAKGGYSPAALFAWAHRLDRKAEIDEKAADRTDRLVAAARPALLAGGLTAAQATLVTRAGTGDLFVYVFAG